jgi:hypothetical protein
MDIACNNHFVFNNNLMAIWIVFREPLQKDHTLPVNDTICLLYGRLDLPGLFCCQNNRRDLKNSASTWPKLLFDQWL